MVKNAIDFNTSGNVAMFVGEPIQGAGGVHEMPKGFIKKAAEHARAAGGLYAADEVQCGFARSGTYWGYEKLDVTPDIVIMAKTMGNGIPMAGVAMRKEVADSIDKVTLSTYAANPLAITSGREVLKIIDEEGLVENSRLRGEQFLNGLRQLQSRYEIIGDIRG
jgi:alanine-glyoxylate transaminase/(R)-3-amino-2-methylpropionate-pyruvate transaminase